MNQLRVYLSSTFEDLKAYRAAVLAKLEQAGLSVAQMESYVATDERPVDKCLADVAASDIYVGIFAWRYGYEPPSDHGNPLGRSITDLEYRQAEASQLRKLIFFAHPSTKAGWPDRFVDERTGQGEGGAKLERFRGEVGTEKLASFFREPTELAGLVLAAVMRSGKTGRIHNIPPRPPGFVPRPALTDQIVQALTEPGGGASGRSAVIQGAGGFGKTTLAMDAAQRGEVIAAFPDGLLWTVLGERPDLSRVLSDLHGVATGSPPAVTGTAEIAKALGRVLGGRRCLLVVDDVWRADDLAPFLQLVGPVLLVTTRVRSLLQQAGQSGWPEVPVDEMDAAEATGLLGRGMAVDDSVRRQLETLAEQLGNWPLLLDLANARMTEEHRSRPGQLAACITKVTKLFALKGVLGFDRRDAASRNAAVAKSVEVGLERAEEMEPGLATKAAELSVFAEDMDIPVQVLADLWSTDPDLVEEDVLRHLDNLSLVRWDRESNSVRLHDMIRLAFAAQLIDAVGVHARLVAHWGDPFHLPHPFAWHWYAWHCAQAGETARLETLLVDLSWVQARLEAATRTVNGRSITDVTAVGRDYALVADSSAASLVGRALSSSAGVVVSHQGALAQQLYGRLGRSEDPRLQRLLQDCAARVRQDLLAPLRPALLPPSSRVMALVGHEGPVRGVLVIAEGRRAISWSEDKTLRLWDLASGHELQVLRGHTTTIEGVDASSDGRYAVSWSVDDTVLWNLGLGRSRKITQFSGPSWFPATATLARFLPDGHRVLTWQRMDTHMHIRVPDRPGEDQAVENAPRVQGGLVLCHGKGSLTWQESGSLRLWGLGSGDGYRVLAGRTGNVSGAAQSPDGNFALLWSRDGMLRLWALEQDAPPRLLDGRPHGCKGACVLAGGRHVLSWTSDSAGPTAVLWDLTQEGEPVVRPWPPAHTAPATEADAGLPAQPVPPDPLSDPLAVPVAGPDADAGADPFADLYALFELPPGEGQGARTVAAAASARPGPPSGVSGALPLPDGQRLLAWDASAVDHALWLWDLQGQAGPVALVGHRGAVLGARLLPDGQRALSWSEDNTLRLWDLTQGRSLDVLEGHASVIVEALVSEDGRRVVSRSVDNQVRAWDLDDPFQFDVPVAQDIQWAAWTADVSKLLLWTCDLDLMTWDLSRGGQIEHVGRSLGAPIMLPGGRHAMDPGRRIPTKVWGLLPGCASGELPALADVVHRWPLPDGCGMLMWTEACDLPHRIELQPDGAWKASMAERACHRFEEVLPLPGGQHALCRGFYTSELYLVELRDGGLKRVLSGHSRNIEGVLMWPDGLRALSWSEDLTLRVWDLARGLELQVLAGHTASIQGAAVVPGGRYVLSWSEDRTVRLWDLTGSRAPKVLASQGIGRGGVLVSADGLHALLGETGLIWNLGDADVPLPQPACEAQMLGARLMHDGQRALCWFNDSSLKLLDLRRAGQPVSLGSEPMGLKAACPVPGGRFALTVSNDSNLWLWDLQHAGEGAAQLDPVPEGVLVLPGDQYAVTWRGKSEPLGLDLHLWQLETGRLTATIPSMPSMKERCFFYRGIEGHDVASWISGLVQAKLSEEDACISDLDFNYLYLLLYATDKQLYLPNGYILFFYGRWGGERKPPYLYRPFSNEPEFHLPDECVNVSDGLLFPDGQRALLWSGNSGQVWDLHGRVPLNRPMETGHQREGALLLHDGRRLLTWGRQGNSLQLWDLEQSCLLRELVGQVGHIGGVLLLVDGRHAVSWGRPRVVDADWESGRGPDPELRLRLWDLECDIAPVVFAECTGELGGLLPLPDGRQALSWDEAGKLLLWDLEQADARPRELVGHKGRIQGVLLLPDGQRALSWSSDCSLRLWELRTARALASYFLDAIAEHVSLGRQGAHVVVGDAIGYLHIVAIGDASLRPTRVATADSATSPGRSTG